MFITSEGNYGFGNAKVSYYNFSDGNVTADVFQPKNNRPLGDVCQSMAIANGKGYIVVNNSGKVEVVNTGTFASEATITGFTSPRCLLAVSAAKAYVSDLYANAVSIVDLNTNHITGSIPCSGWTEQMLQSGANVYVAGHTTGKVYVINSLTDQLTDSIAVAKGAGSLAFDSAGKLWVLCGGETSSGTAGGLYRISTAGNSVEQMWPVAATDGPVRLQTNAEKDTLFYLDNGVFKMWTGAAALPGSAFIAQGSRNFYALGINPHSRQVYVGDAIDYTQAGKVYIYSSSGIQQSYFSAGTIPGSFTLY